MVHSRLPFPCVLFLLFFSCFPYLDSDHFFIRTSVVGKKSKRISLPKVVPKSTWREILQCFSIIFLITALFKVHMSEIRPEVQQRK